MTVVLGLYFGGVLVFLVSSLFTAMALNEKRFRSSMLTYPVLGLLMIGASAYKAQTLKDSTHEVSSPRK